MFISVYSVLQTSSLHIHIEVSSKRFATVVQHYIREEVAVARITLYIFLVHLKKDEAYKQLLSYDTVDMGDRTRLSKINELLSSSITAHFWRI